MTALFMASDRSHVLVSHSPEFISGSLGAKNKLFSRIHCPGDADMRQHDGFVYRL